jgi:hypothetical protein
MSRDAAFNTLVAARRAEATLRDLYRTERDECEAANRALAGRRRELSAASAALTAAHEAYITIARDEAEQVVQDDRLRGR